MHIRLKAALIATGKPQYRIANELRISETRLSRIVRGRLKPSLAEARRLVDLLEAPLEALFEGQDAFSDLSTDSGDAPRGDGGAT